MRPKEAQRAQTLKDRLTEYHGRTGLLVGIEPDWYLDCLAEQLVESRRRIEFVHHLRDSAHSTRRLDPADPIFDPLRAAVLQARKGDLEEAHWLVFLATHFGKHARDGWRLTADVYDHSRCRGRERRLQEPAPLARAKMPSSGPGARQTRAKNAPAGTLKLRDRMRSLAFSGF